METTEKITRDPTSEELRYLRFRKEVEDNIATWPHGVPIPTEWQRAIERALKELRWYEMEFKPIALLNQKKITGNEILSQDNKDNG